MIKEFKGKVAIITDGTNSIEYGLFHSFAKRKLKFRKFSKVS